MNKQRRPHVHIWYREEKNAYGVPREQKMLKGHLPRVIYHQVYCCFTHTKNMATFVSKAGPNQPPRIFLKNGFAALHASYRLFRRAQQINE